MKHYDYVEWVLYKNSLLDDEIYEAMEEHLLLCDECMEIFLSLINEEEIFQAEELIPEDFTLKVMDRVKDMKPVNKPIPMKKKYNRKQINDFFVYYVAVASVAIILTAGGFFGKMVDTMPQVTSSISSGENSFRADKIYNFSEKITKKASKFVNEFQFRISKED